MKDLQIYHSKEYVHALYKIDKSLKARSSFGDKEEDMSDEEVSSDESSNSDNDDATDIEELKKQFGLVDDAHDFKGMVWINELDFIEILQIV